MGAFIIANAQSDCDYNPYRYNERKAEAEQSSAQARQEFYAKECDTLLLQELYKRYNETKDIGYLDEIMSLNCSDLVDFAFDLFKTSPDEKVRQIAIIILGTQKYYDVVPLLLNQVKKDISFKEKMRIARILATSFDRKTEALEILDCNCYDMDYMDDNCIYSYFELFDHSTAIKYFEHYFNKPETQLEAACWLAQFGVYDKTFPLFVEYLKNNTSYERETVYSLVGLAAIGTEEAFETIKEYAKNTEGLTSDTATRILDTIMKERRIKCKD